VYGRAGGDCLIASAARRFIETRLAQIHADVERILSGDRTPLDEYAVLAGGVPKE
jgi:hypothetical protein